MSAGFESVGGLRTGFRLRERTASGNLPVYFLKVLAVAAAYFAAGRLGLAAPFTSGNVSPVWPPAGIALASILLLGNAMWPGITLGAFFVNLFSPIPAYAALGIAIGSTLGPLTGAWLLRRMPGFHPSLPRLYDVLGLCSVGALGGTAVAATIGVASLSLWHVRAWSGFGSAWAIWWLGDGMGVLTAAPLILTARRLFREELRGRVLEFIGFLAAVAACCVLMFDPRVGFGTVEETFGFAVFPFVIWIAVRFGIGGAAVSSLMIAVISVWETASGYGPFVRNDSPLHNAAILQSFLAVISVSGLALAAAIAERQRVERALQRQTEEALAAASQGLSLAQQTANIGTWEWNISTGSIQWSPELEQIHGFGVGTFDGRFSTFQASVHPQDWPEVQAAVNAAVSGRAPYDIEYRSLRPDGSTYWTAARGRVFFDSEGKPARMVGICMDISSRKMAEEALRRTEKLAATGRLAATMAHEINNPLEAVTNLLFLAIRDSSLRDDTRKYLQLADDELRRVSHLAKQTLGFYRDTSSPKLLAPAEILDEVLLIYDKKLRAKHLQITRRYQPGVTITALAGDLRQMLSNLLANAIDASPDRGLLKLHVAKCRDWKSARAGARISIGDTGSGIAPEQKTRIFEPFYTTKQDIGTGLGLWVTSTIVEKHGGSIRFRSRCGPHRSGTVFSVFLPDSATVGTAASD